MSFIKKFLCILCVISVTAVSFSALVYAVDVKDMTYLYIDKGNIVIGDKYVSGYGAFGEKISAYDSNGYCITSTEESHQTNNTIEIDGGKNTVVIKNINISAQNQFESAFCVSNSAEIQLILIGENKLISGASRAGLEISDDSAVIIDGAGSLYAESRGEAGIGGGNGTSNGTLIINSGTITAKTSYNSAGIGGGSSGSGGNITINGGAVTAYGGDTAAGIGGGCASSGGNITINGGTITAYGGENAAGIGGGWYGEMGNVIINGGSVKAVGGTDAPNIGDGAGLTGSIVKNSNNERLYLAVIDASAFDEIENIYTNGVSNKINNSHPDDKSFYFYLPAGEVVFAVKAKEQATAFFMAKYNTAFTCTRIQPITASNGAYIRTDDIIGGITCSLKTLDKYLTLADGFSLEYSDSVIGTGTQVRLIYSQKCVYIFKTLLYGDVNGDGCYDAEDSFIVLLMIWDKLNTNNTEPIYFEAADANRNGAVDEDDVKLLQYAGLLYEKISQQEPSQASTDLYEEYTSLVDQSDYSNISQQKDLVSALKSILTNIVKFLSDFIASLTNFMQM